MPTPTKTTILYKNQCTIIGATTASCSDGYTSTVHFPSTKLIDEDISSKTRSRTEGTTYWLIDFGRTASFDAIVLGGHNFTGNGTYEMGYGATDTPSLSGIAITSGEPYVNYIATKATARYIRFSTIDTTGDGYHEIGEIWAGMKTQLGQNPQIPIKIVNVKDTSVLRTAGGQRWTYENYSQKGYELQFVEDVTPAIYASMEAVYDNRGHSKPFWIHLAPTDTNDTIFLGYTENFEFDIDGKDRRPGNWKILEEK